MNPNKAEKGQALVLIILALVGMFGFAALAVDGGRLYSERRRAQAAADATALSVAFASSQGTDYYDAEINGLNLALTNGFDDNGVSNEVTIYNPPISGPYLDDTEYYQVFIWQHVDPVFSHLFFPGEEGVTVEAVAFARPISSVSSGQAIHSLDPSDESMTWNGTADVHVSGGNIFSNGDITKNGTGNASISVSDGGVLLTGGVVTNGNPNISPVPEEGVNPQEALTIPTPYCPPQNETWNGVNYYYHSGLHSSAVLQPGFHCFYGDIQLGGGDLVKGDGVVLVMMDGGITMTGNSAFQLKRPNDIVDKNGYHWGGMLIYAPPSNTNTFTLNGTNNSYFMGTVYIPRGLCDISGTPAGTGMHMALICWQVEISGTADLNILYREEENFRFSSTVELAQ